VKIEIPEEFKIHALRLWKDLEENVKEIKLISEDDQKILFFVDSITTFGNVIQWICVNRHSKVPVVIQPISERKLVPLTFVSGFDPVGNDVQGYPIETQNPKDCINFCHVHLHFDENTENKALKLFYALQEYMAAKESPPHYFRIWYSQNGPHLGWSWDAHWRDPKSLGLAVNWLIVNKPDELSSLVHARTHDDCEKNEWDDHAHRLAWIGPPDAESVFDIKFFVFRLPREYQSQIN